MDTLPTNQAFIPTVRSRCGLARTGRDVWALFVLGRAVARRQVSVCPGQP